MIGVILHTYSTVHLSGSVTYGSCRFVTLKATNCTRLDRLDKVKVRQAELISRGDTSDLPLRIRYLNSALSLRFTEMPCQQP